MLQCKCKTNELVHFILKSSTWKGGLLMSAGISAVDHRFTNS